MTENCLVVVGKVARIYLKSSQETSNNGHTGMAKICLVVAGKVARIYLNSSQETLNYGRYQQV